MDRMWIFVFIISKCKEIRCFLAEKSESKRGAAAEKDRSAAPFWCPHMSCQDNQRLKYFSLMTGTGMSCPVQRRKASAP